MKRDYPLYVVSSGITEKDREIFEKIFNCTNVSCSIRYVDIDFEDVDIKHRNAVVAVGGKALKAIIQDVKKTKIYDITRILGKDFVDADGKFFLYTIPFTFTEMMVQENKHAVWEKMKFIADRYKEVFIAEDSVVIEDDEEDTKTEVEETITTAEFSPHEILDKLAENINLNDPGLLKSFNKYERIILNTSSGVLNVLPTNRAADLDDEMTVTIKDLVVLLKLSETLGVNTFTFEKKDGISVSVD